MAPVDLERSGSMLMSGPLRWFRTEFMADISCANGHIMSLQREHHTIDENGNVHASVICPHEGCDFHEFVRLAGWS